LVGAICLVIASLFAPLSPEVIPLAVALFLLGLGWNFCYVGGSALLADQLNSLERSRTQGVNDLLVGIAAAVGSFISGLIFSAWGYGPVGTIGLFLALIPLGMTFWWWTGQRRMAVSH
jgi:MFS family permease